MTEDQLLRMATREEIRQFYHEEYKTREIPKYITKNIHRREFAFDRIGKGPRDRFNQFRELKYLERTIKAKAPYAAYSSVALYNNPTKREGWDGAEMVFDVDAKDIPIRTCNCKQGEVCPECLEQAKEIILLIRDNIQELGYKNIHYVYSGRGYHLRIQDPELLQTNSNFRTELVNYVLGAEVPELTGELQHFIIPFGYSKIYTNWFKYTINHLDKNKKYPGFSKNLKNDIIKRKELVNKNQWGLVRGEIKPTRYDKITRSIAGIHKELCDTKVSIDLKRILRLPSTLHYKVSMKCTAIKNIETFDPFDDAVPNFIAK